MKHTRIVSALTAASLVVSLLSGCSLFPSNSTEATPTPTAAVTPTPIASPTTQESYGTENSTGAKTTGYKTTTSAATQDAEDIRSLEKSAQGLTLESESFQ